MSTYPNANNIVIPIDDRIVNTSPLPSNWDPSDKTLLDATRLMAIFTNICNGAYRNSAGKIYATLDGAGGLNSVTGVKGEIAYCTDTDSIYKWDISTTSWIELNNSIDIAEDLATKVDKVTGKGLSTNDYTTTEKNKLSGIEGGAEVNDVVDVKVNGVSVVDESKIAQIPSIFSQSYSQIADKTIANSIDEISLLNTTTNEYIKTNIISANSLKAGDVIIASISGKISGEIGSIPTIKVKLGGVVLGEIAKSFANDYIDVDFEIIARIMVRSIGASGTALVKGNMCLFSYIDGGSIEGSLEGSVESVVENINIKYPIESTQSTINTTTNNAIDVTLEWSSASILNTVTSQISMIEIKKV